jgi:hypothetical protein
MTREEREIAITNLEGIKRNYIEGYGYEEHPLPEYYAIEAGIEALKQNQYRADLLQIAYELGKAAKVGELTTR